jgi:methionine synthase I (cobalamin-dependent)
LDQLARQCGTRLFSHGVDLGRLLTSSYDALRDRLPALAILGGCCGTDARHVAALPGV